MITSLGLGLSQRFYEQLVAPMLAQHYPAVPYAAARIGIGSEVLGYDTAMSADHDYGPCVQIFLPDQAFPGLAGEIMQRFDAALPERFEGWSVRYPTYVRPPSDEAGMLGSDHGVELYTLAAWCERFLGRQFAPELTAHDWLAYPEQLFLTVTAGAVFRDDVGDLTALRERLAYFPRDVWLYKLAAQWGLVAQERAYIGRAGSVGDELGSRVIAARMVERLMRLAMLIERRYAPYPKWFGTAFARLGCAAELGPMLEHVLAAANWQEREAALMQACRFLAQLQLVRGVPGAIAPAAASLHRRPFRFIDSGAISDALLAAIDAATLRAMPEFGAADQFISSAFVLALPKFSAAAARGLFELP